MRQLIGLVIDRESGFEIQKEFGRSIITMPARIDGFAVGIVATNPLIYAGAMDHTAARKQTRFIQLCDTFHIPIIYLVDQPGS
ncbi:hypothetical protein CHELA1G11_21017 [Hyphomicrobiales bacterium]|nr:hypothetical protein CHELA1G11_21017 [Hyphomicrobiales bacterium]CAH1692974.1 hypothetical protein CHELA1G2_21330 [Hyphomicrobiales bacterium]